MSNLHIIARSTWRARPPRRRPASIPLPSRRLWLHHTATDTWHGTQGMREIQNFHMDSKHWNDIGYSFVVDRDGTVYTGRGEGILGAHTEGDNDRSHGICAMGNFNTTIPTDAMIASIVELVKYGASKGWWPNQITGGHRDAPGASTQCPGNNLHARIPQINRLVLEGDDMFDQNDRDQLSRIHHELVYGDANAKTAVQMLQDILTNQAAINKRLTAIENKL